MSLQSVTANRLGDGAVVYMTAAGGWSEALDEAARVPKGDDAATLLRRAEALPLEVVGPYLIDVAESDAGLELASVRERIRAAGPSVRLDHGKQAGN